MTLKSSEAELALSWDPIGGTITLRSDGTAPVRLVPLASSLASMEPEQLRLFIAEADACVPPTCTTVGLYPTPPPDASYHGLDDQLAHRLQALAHEGAATKPPRVGFLPISPWDLSSVERVRAVDSVDHDRSEVSGLPADAAPPPASGASSQCSVA